MDDFLKNDNLQKKTNIYSINNNKSIIKILAIADTHLGCFQDRVDLLYYLQEMAQIENIDYVLHLGDVVDGISNFQDHLDNLRYYTYDMQKQYFLENYPIFSAPTIMISGNHDNWWNEIEKKDIIADIAQEREDIIYLGGSHGLFRINNYNIFLVHSNRRNERIMQRYSAYEMDTILRGHVHTHLPFKKDSDKLIQVPCLVSRRYHENSIHNSYQELGVWWIKINLENKSLTKNLEVFSNSRLKRVRSIQKFN